MRQMFFIIMCCLAFLGQAGCIADPYVQKKHVVSSHVELAKKKFIHADFESPITFIGIGRYDEEDAEVMLVLSGRKAYLLSLLDRRVKRAFSLRAGIRPVAVPTRKSFLILATGGGYSNIALIDSDGRFLWKHDPDGELPVNQMIAGDLNNDGDVELYIAGRRGLYRLDLDGAPVWKYGEHQYTGVGLVKCADDRSFIIAKSPDDHDSGSFQLVDLDGKAIRSFKSPLKSIISFQICDWPSSENILAYSGSVICVFNLKGEVLLKHDLGEQIFAIAGVSVKLNPNGGKNLAVLAKLRSSTRQSKFIVFSPEGSIVHEETLAVTLGIEALENEQLQIDHILVGDGQSGVWLYANADAIRSKNSSGKKGIGAPRNKQ